MRMSKDFKKQLALKRLELEEVLSQYDETHKINPLDENEEIKKFRVVLVDKNGLDACIKIKNEVQQMYINEVANPQDIPKNTFFHFALLLNTEKVAINYSIKQKNMYKNVITDKLIYHKYFEKEWSIHVNKLKHNAREKMKLEFNTDKLTPSQIAVADNSISSVVSNDKKNGYDRLKNAYDHQKEKFIGYSLRYTDFPGKERYSINFRYKNADGEQKYLREWLDDEENSTGVPSILWYEPIDFHNANYAIEEWMNCTTNAFGNIYFIPTI